MEPTVSILIPIKNNVDTIAKCLNSISSLEYPKDRLNVYVIDAFSKDGTQEVLQRYEKDYDVPLFVIESTSNAPLAYNIVLKEIESDVIAFTDGDAVVDKEWLKILLTHLKSPEVAGAGGIILTANPENKLAKCIGYELQDRFLKLPKFVSHLPTMNLVIRRDSLPSFNESLPTGYDAELCYKIIKGGKKLVYAPNAKVYHYHRDSIKKFFRQQFEYAKNEVAIWLNYRHLYMSDAKSPMSMHVQPIVGLAALMFLFLGMLFTPLLYLGAVVLSTLTVYWLFASLKLAVRFKELSLTPHFFVIHAIRTVAWALGGLAGVLKNSTGKVRS